MFRMFIAVMVSIISLLLWSPAQAWTEHVISTSIRNPFSVVTADFNGDGNLDVITSDYHTPGLVSVWLNLDGDGISWLEVTLDASIEGAYCVYAEDVDGDGDMDGLVAASYANTIAWYENINGDGLTWHTHVIDNGFGHTTCVYAKDMNNDNMIDVIGGATSGNMVSWWENTGSPDVWVEHVVDDSFYYAYRVFAEDVNNDGLIDILGAGADGSDDITWWENSGGAGVWIEHTINGNFNNAVSVHAMDVNGDGHMDVLGAASDSNQLVWWQNNNGSGLDWTEHIIDCDLNHVWSVWGVDMDLDGDVDVLSAASYADEIVYYKNLSGDGTVWETIVIDGDFDGAWNVYADDVDGDGDMDILGAAANDDLVVWWEQEAQTEPIVLTLWPENTEIPPQGGTLSYSAHLLSNVSLYSNNVYYWTNVILPNGNSYPPNGWLTSHYFVLRPYMDVLIPNLTQNVPGYAPAGEYLFEGHFGFRNGQHVSDSFSFAKTGLASSEDSSLGWDAGGKMSKPVWHEQVPALEDFVLSEVFPNPFNMLTNLTVELPEQADLSVVVYNVTGQQIAELASGQYRAGAHSFVFDATGLASGLYFVRTTVLGHLDEVQKVMLVR